MSTIFVAGIDTDTGKSVVTGLLAKYLMKKKVNVITQKMSQTGCEGLSEDIETHRSIMGVDLFDEDKSGLTCPYVFKLPASPHLSAKLENVEIDPDRIYKSTLELEDKFETVLLEGVGGLHVPLNSSISLLDYLEEKKYPVILVSSPKLGSINHTLLSLEVLKNRNIPLMGIVYNMHAESSPQIVEDSKSVFLDYLKRYNYPQILVEVPKLNSLEDALVDFSGMI